MTLTEPPTPCVYLPLAQNHETGVSLLVRASVAPSSLTGALRREIQGIDPNLPVPDIRPATDLIASSLYATSTGSPSPTLPTS